MSLEGLKLLAFKAVRENQNYWKRRCLQAENELERMRSNNEGLNMNPLKLMPAHCFNLILHNLTGKEILKAREVSSEWCAFIERENNLMQQAVDSTKILVKSSGDLPSSFFEFKNLEVSRAFMSDYWCIEECKDMVETFKIKDGYDDPTYSSGFTFSLLRKIEIVIGDPQWLKWLAECSFPVLSEYKLIIFEKSLDCGYAYDYEERYDLNSKLLKRMPGLKRYLIYEGATSGLNPEYEGPFPFELEYVFSNWLPITLIRNQADWIKELHVDRLDTTDLHTIELMSQLKTLRVGEFYRNVPYADRHIADEALEVFLIDSVTFLELGYNEDKDEHQLIKVLLRGLPSLETFICCTMINEDNLRFIASTLPNLKTLFCEKVSMDVLEIHREMQRNEIMNGAINTNFKIVIILFWKSKWFTNAYEARQRLPSIE